ncbi:MAG TPA: zinc-ribbon domain-containing protein [Polyangiaceae bacterium]|nr:zinc-ribbon domain-containing protein [Polyangiaceae bacterium]
MDVQCERCKSEYEFDDALVSGRGTTVRCTTCGHQFKVRRAQGDQDGDRWMVRTTGGRELTFLTLRELQRAILAKQVTRRDALVRGQGPGRPLGEIAELEPFFEGRTSSRPPPMGNTSPGSVARELPTGPLTFPKRSAAWEEERPAPPPPRTPTAIGVAPPPRRKIDTLRPPLTAGAPPPPPPPIQPQRVVPVTPPVAFEPEPPSEDPTTLRPPPMHAPVPPPGAPAAAFDPGPRRRSLASVDDEVTRARGSLPSAGDFGVPRPRRVGGWIVAAVLMLAVGVVGFAVAKPYLLARSTAVASRVDPRAQAFIAAGEKALVDGDLDVSQEDFDKASALAEHDPRVLLDEAHVAAAKADVPWLKLRSLPPDATEEIRATKAQLEERVARARRSADEAIAAAPDDAGAIRARIDALRLAGAQEAARGYVGKVIAQASQAETAYVLAALDLAEPDPLWTTVIERLRLAAAGEGNAGRARAALVYALAKSGDAMGAKAELAKLEGLTRPYPLLPNLHALVDRTAARPVVADAGAPAVAVRADSPPVAPAAAAGPGNGSTSAAEPAPAESKGGMAAAAAALKKGDFEKARQIYEGIVARSPADSEALAGLGDVARLQGDTASAIASYKRAIGVNPSYLPALLGLADTQWAGGSHATAAKAYADIVDRFPEGTYPSYVKGRAESAAAPPAQPKAAEAPVKALPTAATDEL